MNKKYDYDLVVAGGGTAGAIAGISAAREGLKVLIVEQYGSLGGTQTLGMVTPVMLSGIPGNSGTCSIGKEIAKRLTDMGYAASRGDDNAGWFDPLYLSIVLEQLAVESGCGILYHTVLTGANVSSDKRIKSVSVHNKDGFSEIAAKCFVDATGDGDLAYMSGVPFESGNDEGVNQSVSLRFIMSNVDLDKLTKALLEWGQKTSYEYPIIHTDGYGYAPGLKKILEEKKDQGYLTEQDLSHFQMFSLPGRPESMAFNCPELGKRENVLDAEYMSQKQIEGKVAILRIARFVQSFVPGFEDAYVSGIAPMIGFRETRRFKTEYFLTTADILNYSKFQDGIAVSNYPVDVHGLAGNELIKKYDKNTPEQDRYYEIPYRSIVPQDVDNLLIVGRCAGFDFIAQSSARVTHTCRAMGEAAGIACAKYITDPQSFRSIDGAAIRNGMIKRGSKLEKRG